MTIAKIEEAVKLKNEIKEVERMVNSLQNTYVNFIRATAYAGNKEDDAVVTFSSGDELHDLILDYFKSKLENLVRRFEQL